MSILRLVMPEQVVLYDGPIPAATGVIVPDVLLGPYDAGTDLVFELIHNGYVDRSDRPVHFYVNQVATTFTSTGPFGELATTTLQWRDLDTGPLLTLKLYFGFAVTVTDPIVVTSAMRARPKGRQTHFY